jgi:SAM-dependent methyltransferase
MSRSWAGTADAYDASFAKLCAGPVQELLTSLGPMPAGRSMLDVGCGPGTVALAARHAGFVAVGVDPDDSMLRLAHRSGRGIAWVGGALPDLPFPEAAFDVVAANFVVSHTPDPRASIREMRRVTRPGGQVAVTIWTGVVGPMNQLWNDVMAAASVTPSEARTLPPDRDFERTTEGLAGLMSEAGLDDVVVREVSWLFGIPADDLWRAVQRGVATIGQTYRAQQPRVQRKMREAYARLTHARYPDGALRFPSSALLASAARTAG